VARHTAEMARVAYITCGDVEMARDAVQSAWQTAWTKLPGLRRPTSVRSWLLAVAANEARQIARRERRRRSVEPGALTIGVDTVQPDDDFGLRRALEALPVDDRRLLAMRYGAGLTSEEIGRLLGISASGTRVRLMRLLTRLRVELRDDGP
ncbi:MAG: sigma-70 family RNA polymerase sigma factor, partial [Chloroflexota bacterium]